SAQRLGMQLIPVLLDHPVTPTSYRDAFDTMIREGADTLYLGNASENYTNGSLIAQLALAARLPGTFLDALFPRAGGLMSYGPDLRPQFRGMAGYVDRILRGASPADLPVQLPRTFDFVVNLTTARALGLTIPERLLVFATEVIE